MSESYNKIVPRIVASSLHHGGILMENVPVEVRHREYAKRDLFKSLIALKDHEDKIRGSDAGIATAINMHSDDFRVALDELMKPDSTSSDQEHEGRRVVRIPGGLYLPGGKGLRVSTGGRAQYMKEWRAGKKEPSANGKATGLKGKKTWELTEIKHHTELMIANLKNDDTMKTTGPRGQRILTEAAKVQLADYERQCTAITAEISSRGNVEKQT